MAHGGREVTTGSGFACAVLAFAVTGSVRAEVPVGTQPPATTPAAFPAAGSPGARKLQKKMAPTSGPEFENVLKALEALTPEQRQRFRENLNKWISLSPEEKHTLRDREEMRKKHMVEEIEAALQKAGLHLDPPRRQAFVRRYTEERRKIEEELRKEADAKRAPMVEEMVNRLKVEFGTPIASP